MSCDPHRDDWRQFDARTRALGGAAFLGAAVVIVLLRSWSTHQPLFPMLRWLALYMVFAGSGAALGGVLVSRLSSWRALRVPWWRCAARGLVSAATAVALVRAVWWDALRLSTAYLATLVAMGVFIGLLLLLAEGIVPVIRLALSGLRRGNREGSREAIRRYERHAAEQFLREEGLWQEMPTELIAAEAPAGRGTELEQAAEPAGRGTELETEAARPREGIREGQRDGYA